MKILFVVPYLMDTTPCQRFRFEQYLDIFKKGGINCTVDPFISKTLHKIFYKKGMYLQKSFYLFCCFLKRFLTLLRSFRYDMIFIHREACPFGITLLESFFKFINKKIIYDFDDAIYLSNVSNSNRIARALKNPAKIRKIIELSDTVIVGTPYLKDYALRFNKNTKIIPTTIDTDKYRLARKQYSKDAAVCIGWSGSYTTAQHLILLKNVFRKLFNKFKIQIKVIGAPSDFSIDGLPIVQKEWRLDNEIGELSSFDIGVMPLPDDEWGRGKCGLKALQYMALGIPVVCSPVGVNKEIIRDGANGFSADSEEEWIEKISRLIEDSELRKRIGFAGRKTVEANFSVKANAPKYLEIIKKVINRH